MKLPPMLKRQAQLFEVLISKIGVLSLMLEESREKLKLKSIPNVVGSNGRNDATTIIVFFLHLHLIHLIYFVILILIVMNIYLN